MKKLQEEVRQLISKGKISDVFSLINSTIDNNEIRNQIILLQSRFSRINSEKIHGTLSREEEDIATNQIIVSLLSIIEALKSTENVPTSRIVGRSKKKLNLFISYSHKDEEYRDELETSLAHLKRKGLIETWSDRKIRPGQNWKNEISSNLETADIFIFLISPDFIASDYSFEIELQRAIERHDRQEAVLIPVIIRHSSWLNSSIGNFQVLPRRGKPISSWDDRDEAWLDVYKGIRQVCLELIGKSKDKPRQTKRFKALKKFKVGFFGETGTGKSTLCNSILEKEVMRVSDIFPVTKGIESATLDTKSGMAIEIFDYPGIGESIEGDKRYEVLYEKGFKDLDMIIWVLRSDVRNYRLSQAYLEKIVDLNINSKKKYIVVLNMVDRMDISGIWDEKGNVPGKGLLSMIERKTLYVSGILKIPPGKIIPTSGLKGYNIKNLELTIIENLGKK